MSVKEVVKILLARALYRVNYRELSRIQVKSLEDTISELQNSEKSLIRFGDGEVAIIDGKDIGFQKTSSQLAEELKEILKNEDEKIMVTLPDIFEHINTYKPRTRDFWKTHLMFHMKTYRECCVPKKGEKEYFNSLFSRFYITVNNHEKCEEWIKEIKKIWDNKDLVIIEGETTHNGVGNDLFDSAGSVERIIGPSKDAFVRVREILSAVQMYEKDKLFLVSLGPAAKTLVKRMSDLGYRAIDIGNLDMEYCWYQMNATKKEPLLKHSVVGVKANREAGYDQYLREIRYSFLE